MKIQLFLLGLFLSSALSAQKDFKVYVFVAEECPICCFIGKNLKTLSDDYSSKADFIAVFPQKRSNYKTASLFKNKYGLNRFKIELDSDQILTKLFGATVTPEAIIVNDKDEIIYKGRINDAYASPGRMRHGKVTQDLEIALYNLTKGMDAPKPWPKAVGCYITKQYGYK